MTINKNIKPPGRAKIKNKSVKSVKSVISSKSTKNKKSVRDPVATAAYINKYIDSRTFYKTIKIPLKKIVRDPAVFDSINSYVIMMSRVMNHVSLFLKMFILYSFENNLPFPTINRTLILKIARVICDKKNHHGHDPDNNVANDNENDVDDAIDDDNIIDDDTDGDVVDEDAVNKNIINIDHVDHFFHNVYSETMHPDDHSSLDFTNLTQCIQYEATTLITGLETHIKEHFYDMFIKYCNILCQLDSKFEFLDETIKDTKSRNSLKNKFKSQIRGIVSDIMNGTQKCDESFSAIRDDIIQNIFGGYERTLSIKNDMYKKPTSLLHALIKMSRHGEEIIVARFINLPENQRPLFKIINVFPLKTSVIPGYIPIESFIIARVLLKERKLSVIDKETNQEIDILKDDLVYKGNLLKYNYEIWNSVFRMNHKVFNLRKKSKKNAKRYKKNNYTFNRRIVTDGVGCSILFIRNDKYKADKVSYIPPITKPFGFTDDKYIEDLPRKMLNQMAKDLQDGTKTLAANDPGYGDIAFMTDGKTEIIEKENGKFYRKTNKLRYTSNQRRFETKSKINRRKIDNDKKATIIDCQDTTVSHSMTVKQLESLLSRFNANTCFMEKFNRFVMEKNYVNHLLQEYYCKIKFRNYRLTQQILRQKSDDKFVNAFKKKFGPPGQVILLYGDQDQHGMRFKEPTKGKSMRQLFKKRGYEVYLVDEFRTTMMLYDHSGPKGEGIELEKFCKMKNKKPKIDPKPYYNSKGIKVESKSKWKEEVISHELLRSTICTKIQPVKSLNLESGSEEELDQKTASIKKPVDSLSLNLIEAVKANEAMKRGEEVRYIKTIVNRNMNASLNILFKGRCIIEGMEIPKRLRRTVRVQ